MMLIISPVDGICRDIICFVILFQYFCSFISCCQNKYHIVYNRKSSKQGHLLLNLHCFRKACSKNPANIKKWSQFLFENEENYNHLKMRAYSFEKAHAEYNYSHMKMFMQNITTCRWGSTPARLEPTGVDWDEHNALHGPRPPEDWTFKRMIVIGFFMFMTNTVHCEDHVRLKIGFLFYLAVSTSGSGVQIYLE